MIDRLAELCDRVAELEAENARLVRVIGLQSDLINMMNVQAVTILRAALGEPAQKEEP